MTLVTQSRRRWEDAYLPDRSDLRIKDKLSKEYELSVINGFLLWSALVSHQDANKLSPYFHEEFVKNLNPGETLQMKLKDVKNWVNRHPITREDSVSVHSN